MNKRRHKGFDYEARNPSPPVEEPELELAKVKTPVKRKAATKRS